MEEEERRGGWRPRSQAAQGRISSCKQHLAIILCPLFCSRVSCGCRRLIQRRLSLLIMNTLYRICFGYLIELIMHNKFMASVSRPSHPLYIVHHMQELKKLLVKVGDHNALDMNGDAPVHSYVRRRDKERFKCLMTLLVHSDCDVNLANKDGQTALHLACEVKPQCCYSVQLALLQNRGTFEPIIVTVLPRCIL